MHFENALSCVPQKSDYKQQLLKFHENLAMNGRAKYRFSFSILFMKVF